MKTLWSALFTALFYANTSMAAPAYITALAQGWQVQPIMTVGETSSNGYAMVGVPDGLGAYANADGSFTLLMNHELSPDKGTVRAHGQKGAFVSRWVIEVESLKVQSGADLIKSTVPAGLSFNRFCSADLAPSSAFYNVATSKGYDGPLFLNGEEDKAGGRAFAHALNGLSYELADFGHIAWENLLANPATGDNTLVIGLDDIQNGLLLVYQGNKSKAGNVIQQAGLVGGQLYAVKVSGERFSLVALPNMANLDGKTLRVEAQKLGASGFARPEDGAWDTLNSKVFWFNTTDKIGGDSRLSQLVFDDINNPQAGGSITTKIHASEIGAEMFDNLTVDGDGRVLLEEDPGEHERLSAIWLFEPKTNKTTKLFEANPKLFKTGATDFMTTDEEHSGMIEVTALLSKATWFNSKRRYYLGTTQAHLRHADEKLVEHGQLWLISGPAALQ
ncbi:MAG: hypothetical protein NTU92_08345 [Methylotenera sp.]|nr:hypothetical protein [Methylotenera sp.]